ncbi:MAG: hypothetical protein PHZ19_01645 [Candidatus Thermoplasmatota archaeon]|nr:hypothetical protein [Candidatus Thermoplasmatota archaeon]
MELPDSEKGTIYFEAILSEKKRMEQELWQARRQIRDTKDHIVAWLAIVVAVILGTQLSFDLSEPYSIIVLVLGVIAVLVLLYLIIRNMFQRRNDKKHLKLINKAYPRYVKALDDIANEELSTEELKELYKELRTKELEDIKSQSPSRKYDEFASRLAKRFGLDKEKAFDFIMEELERYSETHDIDRTSIKDLTKFYSHIGRRMKEERLIEQLKIEHETNGSKGKEE